MKKISIKNKLYLNIVPIIIIGIILSFAILYYIANQKYIDYLNEQYQDDIEYLQSVSYQILTTGEKPANEHLHLPDNCSGIRVYDHKNNLVYSHERGKGRRMDISCCDFTTYEIAGYGTLEVYDHCAVDQTDESIGFRQDLIWAVIIAGSITILISMIIINRMANKMSAELSDISEYAGKMETGIVENTVDTDVIEIDNINNSLHNLGIKLTEKERLRKENIDLIKHQISTPLTIIKTTLEGMKDDVIEMDKEYIERCLRENDRVREKLDNLYLDIEKHSDEITIETFNIKDLIEEIISSFKVSFEQKGVKIKTELSNMVLETDKNLLVSSVYNILSNAYKYTRKGNTVSIVLSDKLTISNTGETIDDKDKERIFDPYYRGKNADVTSGKGLGLYDTKNNLKKLGFSIYLDREKKETTFVIDFNLK